MFGESKQDSFTRKQGCRMKACWRRSRMHNPHDFVESKEKNARYNKVKMSVSDMKHEEYCVNYVEMMN